ncbi:GntR family transcriptional regulator [Dactylosporangium sp. NPDC051484]|uniref:GntR family transcriptional regulator n=1 Tax=Dactylosporangium sp. NPDC051484 TaxID=3154942 RepID=UPI0034506D76
MGYQAVAAVLRQEILNGGYPPGAYLPAEGQLVARFGCAKDTVRDAMQVLRRELLIVTGRGRRSSTPGSWTQRSSRSPRAHRSPPGCPTSPNSSNSDAEPRCRCYRSPPQPVP